MKDKSLGLSPFRDSLWSRGLTDCGQARLSKVKRPSSAVTRWSCRTQRNFLRSARVNPTGPRPIQKNALWKILRRRTTIRSGCCDHERNPEWKIDIFWLLRHLVMRPVWLSWKMTTNSCQMSFARSNRKSTSVLIGVVPEVASRHHVVITACMRSLRRSRSHRSWCHSCGCHHSQAGWGSLRVGLAAARPLLPGRTVSLWFLSIIWQVTWWPLKREPLEFPILALLVSGGHTESLVYVSEAGIRSLEGRDAGRRNMTGVGRVMGGLSAGREIDQLAHTKGADYLHSLGPWSRKTIWNSPFSGLKSAFINLP